MGLSHEMMIYYRIINDVFFVTGLVIFRMVNPNYQRVLLSVCPPLQKEDCKMDISYVAICHSSP